MKKTIMLGIAAVALAAWSAQAADGKALWDQHCTMCHGADGKGDTKMGQKLGVKDYSSAAVQTALTDDAASKAIKEGVKDKDGKTVMRGTASLSDDDVKALVAYMRTLKK